MEIIMRLVSLFCLLLLPISALADAPRLLFDQGHRQAFVIEKEGPLQLSQLAELFQQQGWQVEQTRETLSRESLNDIDALIISGAFSPLSPDEIDAVLGYLQRGGKLAVMIHIGQPLLPLVHELGVDVGSRVINEKQNQPNGKTIDFRVQSFNPHPLTENLQSFTIYGGWPLRVFEQQGKPIASSGPHSWVDMNQDKKFSKGDMISPFNVLVSGDYGRGSFAVFADDAIFQNQFLRGGNKALAENLGRWLKAATGPTIEI
jgi:Domain of unknown function (DUF4350)